MPMPLLTENTDPERIRCPLRVEKHVTPHSVPHDMQAAKPPVWMLVQISDSGSMNISR